MQPATLNKIVAFISDARLRAYGNGEHPCDDLVCAYIWNIMLCESLYPVLHILEVGFRNATDRAFAGKYGNGWMLDEHLFPMREEEAKAVRKACGRVAAAGYPVSPGRVIAELSFAFWTGLLNPSYDIQWHGVLKQAFPGLTGKRRERSVVAMRYDLIRAFRNRVFHHNRIVHLDLAGRHARILEALEWLGQEQVMLGRAVDSFPVVCARGLEVSRRIVARLDNGDSGWLPT